MVFSGVFTNENWKVASQTCHFHQLPLLGKLNTLIVFYEQQVLFFSFSISMIF
jgi:hypothetical protein